MPDFKQTARQTAKKAALILIRSALLFYVLLVLALYLFQTSMIFPVQPIDRQNLEQIRKYDPASERVFHNGDVRLHGWHLNRGSHPLSDKLVIFYYGGNADELSNEFMRFKQRADFQTVLVNYRGYGLSTGTPSEQALYEDALLVFDEVVNEQQPEKVILIGRSLGSGIATYVATQRKVDGLVLVTPYDSVAAIAEQHYPLVPISLLIKHPFDSLSRAQDLHMPVVVFKAERDNIVPHRHTNQLIAALPATTPVYTIGQSDHINIVTVPEYQIQLGNFLEKIRQPATSQSAAPAAGGS